MSDTEQLFIVAAGWTAFSAFLAYFVRNWGGRIALFGVLVGVPFWELPLGYANFQKLCKEQAKLVVLEKIDPQESVCVRDLDSGLFAHLTQVGFSRIEVKGKSDKPDEYSRSGRVFMIHDQDPKSGYCLEYVQNILLSHSLRRSDALARRVSDGKVVAKQSGLVWSGMWWQSKGHPLLGRGGMCFADPIGLSNAVRRGAG